MSAAIPAMSFVSMADEFSSTVNSNIVLSYPSELDLALEQVQHQLLAFARDPEAFQQLAAIFDVTQPQAIETCLADWQQNIFHHFPRILVLEDQAMAGAKGAYSQTYDEIYLADSLVSEDDSPSLHQVLLEEYGHSLDARFNPTRDTAGDEGELFSHVISDLPLSADDLQRIATEDDTGIVLLDDQIIEVENSQYGVDFNRDNHPDILWRNSLTGQNIIWFMEQANSTTSASIPTVGSGWEIKGGTDFNRDNSVDLLWRNATTGQNIIWFMEGTTLKSSTNLATVSRGWDIAGIADFNHDDIDDLVWRNQATGTNVVWLMGGVNNSQSLMSVQLPTVGGNWQIKGVADFNHDDTPDLLWRDGSSGQNVVWFMGGNNNAQIIGGANITTVGGSWDIKGIVDFNADKSPDLLWRDLKSGQNIVWFMGGQNNTTLMGGASLATVYGSWTPIASGWHKDPAPSSNFNIQFDYRFDTNGWFTTEKRTALEAAAAVWESIITDEFAEVSANTLLSVENPQTGVMEQFNSDYAIDDLVIFAGARPTTGALAEGGPSGIWYVGSELETRYKGNDFEPWTGSITFDPTANWFFDPNPLVSDPIPSGQSDFVSVAVHEIGHILGIGTADAFDNLVVYSSGSYYFVGTNATAQNGGYSMPMETDRSHIQEGYGEVGATGEVAMDPTLTVGTRKLITRLDAALLDDIGYNIDYTKTYNNL
jgi:hypothetical protein